MYARMLSTKRREMHIVYGTSTVMLWIPVPHYPLHRLFQQSGSSTSHTGVNSYSQWGWGRVPKRVLIRMVTHANKCEDR